MPSSDTTDPDEEDADGRPAEGSAADDPPSGRDPPVEDVPDGAGCTEIWEHLSEQRDEDDE